MPYKFIDELSVSCEDHLMGIDGGFSRWLPDQPLDTPAGTRSPDGRPESSPKILTAPKLKSEVQAQKQIDAVLSQLGPDEEIGVYLVANPSPQNNFALWTLLEGTCVVEDGQRYVPPKETLGEWVDLGTPQAHIALSNAGYHGYVVGARDVDVLVGRDSNDAHGAAAHAISENGTILDEDQIDHLIESGTENGMRAVSVSQEVAGYELTDEQIAKVDAIARAGTADPRSPVANNIMNRLVDRSQQDDVQIDPWPFGQ